MTERIKEDCEKCLVNSTGDCSADVQAVGSGEGSEDENSSVYVTVKEDLEVGSKNGEISEETSDPSRVQSGSENCPDLGAVTEDGPAPPSEPSGQRSDDSSRAIITVSSSSSSVSPVPSSSPSPVHSASISPSSESSGSMDLLVVIEPSESKASAVLPTSLSSSSPQSTISAAFPTSAHLAALTAPDTTTTAAKADPAMRELCLDASLKSTGSSPMSKVFQPCDAPSVPTSSSSRPPSSPAQPKIFSYAPRLADFYGHWRN